MKAARALKDALVAWREWHYRLCITREAFQTNPEPHRAWMSVKPLVPHLVRSVSEFALEWGDMSRAAGMREEAMPEKIRVLQSSQGAMEECMGRTDPKRIGIGRRGQSGFDKQQARGCSKLIGQQTHQARKRMP